MRKLTVWIFLFSCFISLELLGQTIRPVSQGPIHEAYVPRVTENYVVPPVPLPPPPPIDERIPPKMDPETEWIPCKDRTPLKTRPYIKMNDFKMMEGLVVSCNLLRAKRNDT